MPTPALEKLKKTVDGVVVQARETGEKAVRAATPVVRKAVDRAVTEVRSRIRSDNPANPSDRTPPGPDEAPAPSEVTKASPASVAKNVAPPRPSVEIPEPEPAPAPEDVPGGKLPPRR